MNKLITLLTIFMGWLVSCQQPTLPPAPLVIKKSAILVEKGGRTFRDLNHNGQLDVYEDASQPLEARVNDLLAQLTLEEKAGMMFINGAPVHPEGLLEKAKDAEGQQGRMMTAKERMDSLKLTHFNIWQIPEDPAILAKWYNNLQSYAETTRLGIPITLASDPRHHLGENVIAMAASGFTQFCEMPGFAAMGDESFVFEFAEIVRQEYLAVGIREALHPQIDLATEPRWARISGNFSEDAALTARLVKPYIEGLQGKDLSEGVACMTKHFPGGGPQKNGLDPHFEFQEGQIYPGNNFGYHLIPFEAAFAARTAAIMPYYGVPMGQTSEDVGMAYNKAIITDLLRKKYQYDGVVCTDWGLVTDAKLGPHYVWPARAWGVENLSELERVQKIIEAGCDQFGGEHRTELIVELVNTGKITESRLDESVRRLLRQKFQLGLFDNPFVDETTVATLLNNDAFRQLGEKSQMQSLTLLKNDAQTLPLKKGELRVYVENIDSATVANYATVVGSPQEADLAIIRIKTPWTPVVTENFFAKGFHHGDLDFTTPEKERILTLLESVPTVVDIYLDRPAVIPEITAAAKALIANYGTSDKSLCEVLFGNEKPMGNLPFELPSSMEAVRDQLSDLPYDSKDPLFPFGFGLRYEE
ncbi:MAG: glycoside hydrolase family 3 N-terminal domain-containing protein [Saprospiraceae bacterium]